MNPPPGPPFSNSDTAQPSGLAIGLWALCGRRNCRSRHRFFKECKPFLQVVQGWIRGTPTVFLECPPDRVWNRFCERTLSLGRRSPRDRGSSFLKKCRALGGRRDRSATLPPQLLAATSDRRRRVHPRDRLHEWASRASDQARDRERFNDRAREMRTPESRRRLRDQRGVAARDPELRRCAADVTAREFHTYASLIDLRRGYPGIQALGFSGSFRRARDASSSRRCSASDRKAFASGRRAAVKSRSRRSSSSRSDQPNQAAIGFDMRVDPVRRAAMDRARDSGPARRNRKARDDRGRRHGAAGPTFLVFLPVYREGVVPGGVDERRAALEGFVHLPLRSDDLLSAALHGPTPLPLALEVYDGWRLVPRVFARSEHVVDDASREPPMSRVVPFDAAGHPWSVRLETTSAFDAQSRRFLVPYVLLTGLAISIPVSLAVRAQARAREQAERNEAILRETLAARRESETRRLGDSGFLARRGRRHGRARTHHRVQLLRRRGVRTSPRRGARHRPLRLHHSRFVSRASAQGIRGIPRARQGRGTGARREARGQGEARGRERVHRRGDRERDLAPRRSRVHRPHPRHHRTQARRESPARGDRPRSRRCTRSATRLPPSWTCRRSCRRSRTRHA